MIFLNLIKILSQITNATTMDLKIKLLLDVISYKILKQKLGDLLVRLLVLEKNLVLNIRILLLKILRI